MSDTEETARDYGKPGPKTCVPCGTEFHRSLNECPECESTHIGINPHPRDEWTSQLVRDTVRALAGYAVIRMELPCDHRAWMWWDDGFEGRTRSARGALNSFSLGVEEPLKEAHKIELVHWRDTHPQIRQQIEQSLPRPVEAREV